MSEAATQEQPAPTGLTIQDLTLCLQVIQVGTSRGAFKADELTAIGGLYDRLFKFLESTGAITTVPPEEAAKAAAAKEEVAAPTEAKSKKARAK